MFFAMKESTNKLLTALRTLKRKRDGQTYENLIELCSKLHGWDTEVTKVAIEAAKSEGVVKQKSHNGKQGLRLRRSRPTIF